MKGTHILELKGRQISQESLYMSYMQFILFRDAALQSCPTPSDPMDCSLSGSSVHGIFQARVLEWGAIAFSVRDAIAPKKLRRTT